jgi:hypothetical protein
MDRNEQHRAQTGESAGIQSKPDRSDSRVVSWAALGISLLVSGIVSLLLGQDVSWDLQNYHIYSGYAFLTNRFLYDFAPAQLQTFFNPLLHVLTFWVRMSFSPESSAFFFGALQGLNIFLVFQIAQVLFQRWEWRRRAHLGGMCAATGLYASVNIGELGTTFADNMVSIPMLAGILLLIRYLMSDKPEKRIPILYIGISGVLMGVALALKLTVITYVLGVAVAFPIATLVAHKRVRPALLLAVYGGMCAGFLAGYGLWGFKLYKAYQNPFFPLFNNIFRSPFYDFRSTMDVNFIPHTWGKIFFSPFYFAQKTTLAAEQMHRDIRWALCYVAILILAGFALYAIRGKAGKIDNDRSMLENRCLLFLTLFISFSYVCWQYLFSIYRYLSVLEWIVPLFLSLAIAHLFCSQKVVLAASLLINIAICISVYPYDNGRISYDYNFLKVDLPPMPQLENYLVLMSGGEPTSYIIPQFPPRTRFVRISANWIKPGQNARLDQRVRDFISNYDISRILLYCADEEEIGNADITLYPLGMSKSPRQCHALSSPLRQKGYLCEVTTGINPELKSSNIEFAVTAFRPDAESKSNTPTIIAGKDWAVFHVTGLSARAIDVLYTLDGRPMPPQRKWELNLSQEIRMKVGASAPKGLYHFIGIRDSSAPDPNPWLKIDESILVR